MSGDRLPLTLDQLADLRRQGQAREAAIIQGILQVPDYPPLPACPECGQHPERIDGMVEVAAFGVDETGLLVNFKPCGHRFRAVAA